MTAERERVNNDTFLDSGTEDDEYVRNQIRNCDASHRTPCQTLMSTDAVLRYQTLAWRALTTLNSGKSDVRVRTQMKRQFFWTFFVGSYVRLAHCLYR